MMVTNTRRLIRTRQSSWLKDVSVAAPQGSQWMLKPDSLFTSRPYVFMLPAQSEWPHRQTTSARVPMPSQWALQYFDPSLGTQLQAGFAHFLALAIRLPPWSVWLSSLAPLWVQGRNISVFRRQPGGLFIDFCCQGSASFCYLDCRRDSPMTRSKFVLGSVLCLASFTGGVLVAQGPRHPNLMEARRLINQAFDRIVAAQQARAFS